MLTIEEIRAKYPQYKDISDDELLGALHKKFYSNVPREEFFAKFQPQAHASGQQGVQWGQLVKDVLSTPVEAGKQFGSFLKKVPGQVLDIEKQIEENPKEALMRQLQSAGRGVYGLGKGIANIDKFANEYLESRGLPKVVPEFGKELRQIGQSENAQALDEAIMQKLTPEQMRPGDELIEGLARFAPLSKMKPSTALGINALSQNENPFAAALVPSLAKGAAKSIASTAKAVPSIAKGIANAPNREAAAAKVATGEKTARSTASEMYENVIKPAEAKGIKADIKIPSLELRTISKGGLGKFGEYLHKVNEDPTARNIHRAQSDLGKFIRSKEGTIEAGKAPGQVIDAVAAARKTQKSLQKALTTAFEETGDKALTKALKQADKYYSQNVVPFQKLPILKKYIEGDISGADLVKELAKNKTFNKKFSSQYPEVNISHSLTGYGKFDTLAKTLKSFGQKLNKESKGK